MPTIISIRWLNKDQDQATDIPLVSISCLILHIKFILFFRAFESFGVYFAIMLSVARKIFSFLLILCFIIVSFTYAFFILLKPKFELSKDDLGNLTDPNNPWNNTDRYILILDEKNNLTIYKEPDDTNLFSNYYNSLLATYLFLTGIIISIFIITNFSFSFVLILNLLINMSTLQ